MKKILIIALLIRLIGLYLFRYVTNYDLQSYLQVGELTLKGVNIYPQVASLHHPYLPFFLYIEAIAIQIGQISLIGPISIIKVILIIFDLGILYLVYLLSNKSIKTAFVYAINPVTILVTTLHGQFDVISVFFILLALYLIKVKWEFSAVISFSFAILTKTWPIIFAVPILRKVNDRKFTLLMLIGTFPILFIIIYIVFFKSSLIDIGKTLISYHGLWGIWGPWILLNKLRLRWQLLFTLIFLIGYFIYTYINKEKIITKNILKLLFFFFIFTTNFSIQYFVWIVPFLILIKPKNYLYLISIISIYLFSFYYFWLFCNLCKFTPDWLVITQNITGFILWLSFIKIGYLSSK